jgi:hypothetical protein
VPLPKFPENIVVKKPWSISHRAEIVTLKPVSELNPSYNEYIHISRNKRPATKQRKAKDVLMPPIKPGIQILLEERLNLLEGKNVGIITNQTGVLHDLTLNVGRHS